jgi:SAM-dependent methyltransferase
MKKSDIKDFSYSIRRYHVDQFFKNNVGKLKSGSLILDIGGKKIQKRGLFNIENYDFIVQYVNIDPGTQPDFLCDFRNIDVEDNVYDGAIMSEVLEHILEPKAALEEVFRVLKPGGQLLICSPFSYHVHADPSDYYRYTQFFFLETLNEIGFQDIQIEKQGLFFSVLANMLRLWFHELSKYDLPKSKIRKALFRRFVLWFCKKAFILDELDFYTNNWLFSGYTTGFGVICNKRY